jgi:hypothetical protein
MFGIAACAAMGGALISMASAQGGAEEAVSAAIPILPEQVNTAAPVRASSIPEPVSLAIFGTGLLLLLRRRRV